MIYTYGAQNSLSLVSKTALAFSTPLAVSEIFPVCYGQKSCGAALSLRSLSIWWIST